MKKLLSLLFVFAFLSCGGSDDDSQDENNESSTPQNILTIGNNSYSLQDGIIVDYGDWWDNDSCPENFNLDIELYEDTVVTDATGRVISGSGKVIYLEMVSNGENLSNGDYSDITNKINSLLNRNFSSFYEYVDVDDDEELFSEESSCFDANGYVFYRFISEIVDGEEDYNQETTFSFLNGTLEFSRDSSNEITIILTGATTDESGLPVTLNFTGFLAAGSESDFFDKNDFSKTKPYKVERD